MGGIADYIKSFLVGGALCVIGQILIDKTKLTPARILATYVTAGVLLGAVQSEPFAKWAGAGPRCLLRDSATFWPEASAGGGRACWGLHRRLYRRGGGICAAIFSAI